MILRRELERGGRAVAVDLDVVGLVRAVRHVVQRQVRNAHQKIGELRVERLGLVVQRGDLRLGVGDQRAEPFELGLVALRLGGADLPGGGVLLGLRGLGRVDLRAARLVEGEDVRRQGRGSTAGKRGVEGSRVVADLANVVHLLSPSWVGFVRRLCMERGRG